MEYPRSATTFDLATEWLLDLNSYELVLLKKKLYLRLIACCTAISIENSIHI